MSRSGRTMQVRTVVREVACPSQQQRVYSTFSGCQHQLVPGLIYDLPLHTLQLSPSLRHVTFEAVHMWLWRSAYCVTCLRFRQQQFPQANKSLKRPHAPARTFLAPACCILRAPVMCRAAAGWWSSQGAELVEACPDLSDAPKVFEVSRQRWA
jgi:hypothetical protein